MSRAKARARREVAVAADNPLAWLPPLEQELAQLFKEWLDGLSPAERAAFEAKAQARIAARRSGPKGVGMAL